MSRLLCMEAQLLLDLLLSGEINPEDKLALKEHLAVCPVCSRELMEMRSIRSLLANSVVSVPESTDRKMFAWTQGIAIEQQQKIARSRRARRWCRLTTAASLVGALAAAGYASSLDVPAGIRLAAAGGLLNLAGIVLAPAVVTASRKKSLSFGPRHTSSKE